MLFSICSTFLALCITTAGFLSPTATDEPTELFLHSVEVTRDEIFSTLTFVRNGSLSSGFRDRHFNFVIDLLDDSLDQMNNTLNDDQNDDDTHTWLSTAVTNFQTVIDENIVVMKNGNVLKRRMTRFNDIFSAKVESLHRLASNALALHVLKKDKTTKNKHQREWMGDTEDERVLALMDASVDEIKANAVVAKDGTGTHNTVAEALEAVKGSGGRTIIHVKAGTYAEENLKIPLKQKNVMLVGDGKGLTVITGSKSNAAGYSTYDSATFAVAGNGFMARDITFANTAGPGKGQAVALRVASDQSVFYRCSIEGYQDTLYTFSKRQFYRDCDISGTIDFIFGNSAVVFQKCNLLSRTPLQGQKNSVTAQGRSDPNQNTGISIHECRITADESGSHPMTYLGRPWRTFSRTVVMESLLDDVVEPTGWEPWSGKTSLNTLYYGEFRNTGRGASLAGRVKWLGYHAAMTPVEADLFTVERFISGNRWLSPTGVAFDSGLI